MRQTKIIGILGGTFDPVHLGHLTLANELLTHYPFDEIRLIPNQTPPHRAQPKASAKHRLAMLILAALDHPQLIVDERELKREGPSYMIDTLKSLREDFPNASLNLIIGADAFAKIDSWHQSEQLLDYAHFIVTARPGFAAAQYPEPTEGLLTQTLHGSVFYAQGLHPIDVSATAIRQQLGNGCLDESFVPKAVTAYIEDHQLYRGAHAQQT